MADLVGKQNFIEAMSRDNRLSRAALAAGIQLVCRFNNKAGAAWPSYHTLANDIVISERGIKKAVAMLIETGWFHLKAGGGRGHSNRYIPAWERVNHSSPFNAERVNASSIKGEPACQERVNQSSPEPTYIKPINEPIESDLVHWAFDKYNKVAESIGIPPCQKITTERRDRMKARLKDAGGTDGWDYALEKLKASSFLQGDSDGGFKANIDFLLEEKNFTKLMEGNYDGGGNAKQGGKNSLAEAGERFLARRRNQPETDPEAVKRAREQEEAARQAVATAEANHRIHQNEEMVRKRREGIRPLKEKLDKKLRQYTKQVKGKGE